MLAKSVQIHHVFFVKYHQKSLFTLSYAGQSTEISFSVCSNPVKAMSSLKNTNQTPIWGFSENGGTPKRMVHNGKSRLNGWFRGTSIYGNHHIVFLRVPEIIGNASNNNYIISSFFHDIQWVEGKIYKNPPPLNFRLGDVPGAHPKAAGILPFNGLKIATH